MKPSAESGPAVTGARATRPRRSVAEYVVFGAGAVGLAIADVLLARGVAPGNVRVVNRSGNASLPAGVQGLGGDASDLTSPLMARTARGWSTRSSTRPIIGGRTTSRRCRTV